MPKSMRLKYDPASEQAGTTLGVLEMMFEQVNFALADWLPYGRASIERYKDKRRSPIIRRIGFYCSNRISMGFKFI